MSRWHEWVAVGALFAVLIVIVLWPQPVRWLTHGLAHHDALFNMWRLSWIADALTTQPWRLLDPPIFHPAARALAFSDAVLLQGLLATPFLAAGAPILPVSNVILLLGPWLSGMATYLLVRDLLVASASTARYPVPDTRDPRSDALVCWPGLVAGTIFALLPYRVEHLMHLELQWSQWMPLACWALHRTVQGGRVRDGVLTAGFVLAQFLSCIYYGVFLVITLALVAPLSLLTRRRAGLGAIARALLVGTLVCGPPLLAYAAPYRANQQTLGGRSASDIDQWSASPSSFISSPPDNRLYGWTAGYGGPEGRLWSGVAAMLLAAIGVWSTRRRPTTWMYAAMLLAAALLALGTRGPLYRIALATVPPLQGLRAPSRFGMVMALALAVLAGLGACRVLGRVAPGWRRHATGAALVVCLVIEYASQVGALHRWVQREPVYATWLRSQPAGAVVDLPIARANALPHYEAEWTFYGRTHGHPMVNGYSGFFPHRYIALLGAMVAFPRGDSVAALRAHDVRYVVVHEDRYEPAYFLDFDARLRGTPGLTFVGRIPDPDYPATVFTVNAR